MLHFIRERAQGWLAYGIVILIIIPFALWGINQYFGGGGPVTVAKVNGTEINQRQLQMNYLQQRRRMQEMLGDRFDPARFPEKQLKLRVLEQMVKDRLLIQVARDTGFWVGDAQLATAIRSTPAFQDQNGFSQARYERALQAQGMQPAGFEARMRQDLLAGQLQAGVSDSAFITPQELDRVLRLKHQTRDIGFMTLPLEPFLDSVEVTDRELQDYYDANRDGFVVPEQVKVAYLELSMDRITTGMEIPEETVRARYEEHRERYQTPEERQVRHILVEVPADADKAAEEAAREEAEAILGQLRSGADFAELAEEHSDDPGSAKQGGDLGFIGRGMMDPAFEEAAYGLEEGELGGPVRSAFGYHILKLEAVRGGEVRPFSEVRERLRRDIEMERAQPQFYEMAEQLANLAYEQPDSLEPAAEALGLEVQQSAFFDRDGGKGIAAEPKVVEAAFSDEVLEQGFNSETVELETDHLVVLRVMEHKPQRQQSLDDVYAEVAVQVRRQKARDAARADAKALAERIAGGEDPESVAAEAGAEWRREEAVRRQGAGQEVPAPVRGAVFALPRVERPHPPARAVELPSGEQAVVAVFGVTDGDPAGIADKERQSERDTLRRATGRIAYNALLEHLRQSADVTIREDEL